MFCVVGSHSLWIEEVGWGGLGRGGGRGRRVKDA